MKYIITKQGNRNLAPSAGDAEFSNDLGEAKDKAYIFAKRDGMAWYVHKITAVPIHMRRPTVENVDLRESQ